MAIITTMSSHEFNQNACRAMQAAANGPVFIADHVPPARVLLTIDDCQQLVSCRVSIVDQLAMHGIQDIEFDVPRLGGESPNRTEQSRCTLIGTDHVTHLGMEGSVETVTPCVRARFSNSKLES